MRSPCRRLARRRGATRSTVAASRLSRAAADGKALVFGSIGPIGTPVAPAVAALAFRRQAEILADSGADALVLETFGALDEARLAIRAAHASKLPIVASFCFFLGTDRDLTLDHATPEQAARLAIDEGVDAVGANCGTGPADCVSICRRLRAGGSRASRLDQTQCRIAKDSQDERAV